VEALAKLLSEGHAVDQPDYAGLTPLFLAIIQKNAQQLVSVCERTASMAATKQQ
jgi:hypothetical protein